MAVASAIGAAPATASVKRQAVLLIHGMGEQQPMETIRGFASSVWEKDTSLHLPAAPGRAPGELFYVPDSRSGSRELRRVSTRKSRPRISESGDGIEDSVRTDFFEIYWADATRDSTWSDFTNWYWRLLVRTPGEVPRNVLGIWIGLWAITLTLVLLCATIILWSFPSLGEYRSRTWLLALGGLSLLVARTFAGKAAPDSPNLWIANWLGGLGVAVGSVSFAVLAADSIKSYTHDCVHDHPVLVAVLLALSILLAAALATFLVKFFGDVARYCLDTPGNIGARKEIRERGIALVRELTASGQYQRIVLVGHSLGTIVAYDVLTLLWADYVSAQQKGLAQPDCPDVPSGSPLDRALTRCVAAARALTTHAAQPAIGDFRAAQRAVYKELRRGLHTTVNAQPPPAEWLPFRPWLISDLVTIACPLTHAEFLLARNAADLTDRFARRELASCPPAMERGRNDAWQLVYKDGIGPDAKTRIIHDAPFAAVRWTNIHDQPKGFFLLGDIISGPVNDLFGRRAETPMNYGILDVKVAPAYDGRWLPARLFTHIRYWGWPIAPDQGAAPPPDPRQLDSVDVVRKAINLLDLPAVEQALITRAI
jgi:hypothetical protein